MDLANHRRRWLVVAALLAIAACGRRGPVRAPEDIRPAVVTNLSATRGKDGVELVWSRPSEYADGSHMYDLGSFEVLRAEGDAPFERYSIIDVSDRERFRQAKRFEYLDRAIETGRTYRYRVVSSTLDRYVSEPSNIATVTITSDTRETNAPLPTPRR